MYFFYKHRLWIAMALFALLFTALYPLYQYIFDLDAIGYMAVTKRWANGDYYNAINGMWSPLHSWIIVPFYKMGVSEITAFKISNGIISLGILWLLHSLLKKWKFSEVVQSAILFTSIILLLWFSYFEIAADLLVCLPFLGYLSLISSPHFFTNKTIAIGCGILGALCYLSKSYFFPYFLLHFSIMQYVAFQQAKTEQRSKQLLRNMVWGVAVFLVACSAWIITLTIKFKQPTIGFAGEYNYKQSVYAKKPLPLLGEPLVPASTHPWEDISTALNVLYTTPTIGEILVKQVKVLLFEALQLIKNYNELSFCSFAIIFLAALFLRRKFHWLLFIAVVTFITLPMGYVLMHIETRYIWANGFLLLLAGGYLLQELLNYIQPNKRTAIVCWSIFLGSFCIYPVHNLYKSIGLHKDVFDIARQMSDWKCTGRFTSNDANDIIGRACYLTGNVYLVVNAGSFTDTELMEQLKSRKVDYYFFTYRTQAELEAFKNGAFYQQYKDAQLQTTAAEWMVFSLNKR